MTTDATNDTARDLRGRASNNCPRRSRRPLSAGQRPALALLSILLPLGHAAASEGWQTVVEDADNDVVVLQRKLASGLPEFRAVTRVDSSLSGCVALLRDVDSMPDWVDRTIESRVLRRISDTEAIAYNVSRVGWPFEHRDAIVHTTLEQDPESLAVTIRGHGLPGYDGPADFDFRAVEKRYTRMRELRSSWQFNPLPDGRVEVIFQGTGNPGGSTTLPLLRWAMRLAISESPYRTLLGFRRMIGRDRYQRAAFDFIVEIGEGAR